jgi:trehalose/maltose hydrolase-like predicted phosphorylase
MLFYVFSADELNELLSRLGYSLDPDMIPRNVRYYDSRSSHGSTLSRVVHAWVLARSDRVRAIKYFAEALQSDVNDIQQGTTAEGIHLGAMAGTVDLVQRVSTGIEVSADVLLFNPQLPDALARLDMRIRYRGHTLDLKLTRDAMTIRARESAAAPVRVQVKDDGRLLESGRTLVFGVERDRPRPCAEERSPERQEA